MTTPQARYDIYAFIHKALRLAMGETLTRIGRADPADPDDVAQATCAVRALMAQCRSHLEHENDFVHTAMEARRPGSSARIDGEHRHHVQEIEVLERAALAVDAAAGAARADGLQRLYRALAAFVAENFVHMAYEEREHNAVLWADYSDLELVDLEQRIVGSLSPQESAAVLRWMVPALAPAERADLLAHLQAHAPREAFEGLLRMARQHLSERDWYKLGRALGPMPLAA